jgi:sulfide:quinone oxidoreductase
LSSEDRGVEAIDIVIAGGGVAGLEGLLALHSILRDRVGLTLIAPDRDFVYRPLAVAEPFGLGTHFAFP